MNDEVCEEGCEVSGSVSGGGVGYVDCERVNSVFCDVVGRVGEVGVAIETDAPTSNLKKIVCVAYYFF